MKQHFDVFEIAAIVGSKNLAKKVLDSLKEVESDDDTEFVQNFWNGAMYLDMDQMYDMGITRDSINNDSVYIADFAELVPQDAMAYFIRIGRDVVFVVDWQMKDDGVCLDGWKIC